MLKHATLVLLAFVLSTKSIQALANDTGSFDGLYDLIATSTTQNNCANSIEIISECNGIKVYNHETHQSEDFCNIKYPNRNPTFPDRNPPPPDRNPPYPDLTPPKNPSSYTGNYKTVSVILNGNTITAQDDFEVKTIKLEDGLLYSNRFNIEDGLTTRCTYEKR